MFLYDALLSLTKTNDFDAFTLDDIDAAFTVAEAGGPMVQVRSQQDVDIRCDYGTVVSLMCSHNSGADGPPISLSSLSHSLLSHSLLSSLSLSSLSLSLSPLVSEWLLRRGVLAGRRSC